jgi:PAS domain S-box-containing protein
LDRAILHAVEHGIVTVDSKGAITGVNPAAAAILKRSQKELLGTPVTRTLVLENKGEVLPDQQHPATLCLRERRAIHPSASSRLSIACHDDSKVPALLLATPLFQEKKLFGAVIVFQDVHDERLVEELKSEFITLASHQLRTPLAIVRWHADILGQGKKLTMEQQQSIGEMNTALTRMTNLINTLMQVAKLEEGNINPTMESVDICGLLKELCHEISLRAREAGVEMKLSLDRCPCPVPTDPSLIAIVFQNLLGNAVQYTPAGGSVTLSLDMDRSSLLVSVSDTGVGIPARERSRIFEKFFRAQNAQRLWTAGSGLGLYISRMIIERLGGTLSFRTQEGKGSTFIVCLPRAENQKKKRARR